MAESRRALQLPAAGPSSRAQQPAATGRQPLPPPMASQQRRALAQPQQRHRRAGVAGGAAGQLQPPHGSGEMAAAARHQHMLQDEIAKRDRWLQAKNEQLAALLLAKDEQLALLLARDEQLMAQLQAKDEQMMALLQAKDEQISVLLSSPSRVAAPPLLASPPPSQPPRLAALHTPPRVDATLGGGVGGRRLRPSSGEADQGVGALEAPRPQLRNNPRHSELLLPPVSRQSRQSITEDDGQTIRDVGDALQAGGEQGKAALAHVMEHAMAVLESMPRAARKDRKAVRGLCDDLDQALEQLDAEQATSLARQREADKALWVRLQDVVEVVLSLRVDASDTESVDAVGQLLGVLRESSDPVKTAATALQSGERDGVLRGLHTLQSLEQKVLSVVNDSEVSVMSLAGRIGLDAEQSHAMRLTAWKAVFTLWYRCGLVAAEAGSVLQQRGIDSVLGEALSGRLSGQDATAVVAAYTAVCAVQWALANLLALPARASVEKHTMLGFKLSAKLPSRTYAQCQRFN
eukprot:COSAG01_NODE_10226_length_2216_cov_16.202645_1_plen_519_part_00